MNKLVLLAIITAGVLVAAGTYSVFDFNEKKDDNDNPLGPNPRDNNETGENTSFSGYYNNSVVNAMNNFSFDLYKQLFVSDENVFYSPYSVFTALSMTYEGAVGDTASDMANVLGIKNNNETVLKAMKSLYKYFNQNGSYNISTANALWVRENFELLQNYLEKIQNYYGGNASEVDFSNQTQAANIINSWVENHTNGLIEDLVPASVIDPIYTYLILTNAIYFKGIWEVKFDPDNTTDQSFYPSNEEEIQVPTMTMVDTDDTFNYTSTDELQVLELPYKGDDLSMIILLPKEGYTISNVKDILSIENLSSWKDAFTENELDIYLPKFKMETKYELKQYLQSIGMTKPFMHSADFSNISNNTDLFIDLVIHKAYIDVDENGTEAAAATAVVIRTTSVEDPPERIEFRADHPFTFLIQQKTTGNILFMGNVVNPLEQ